MTDPEMVPADGHRPFAAVLGGWALALGGAVAIGSLARTLDHPAVAVAVATTALVVAVCVLGGALAGMGAGLAAGCAAWLLVRPETQLPTGYELGLAAGGVLVALAVGAVQQLRGFERVRGGWRDRLDQLTIDLAALSGADDALAVTTHAAARATGARALEVLSADRAGQVPLPEGWTETSSRSTPALVLRLELGPPPPAILAADFAAFLRSVADQCAQALQLAELERAEQRASADLALLARASAALSASLDVSQVLATIEDLMVPTLADECSVEIAPRGGARSRRATSVAGDDGSRTIPLRAHGALIGELTVRRRGRALDKEEVDGAHLLAEPIGRALDHALLYAEQVHTTTTLEHSLLPEAILPIRHLDVATRYLAAAEGHAVGGDFFDVLLTPDGVAVLVVGDVQGKGVEAATLTSAARHTLRAAALAGASPAGMLQQLNDALLYGQSERLVASDGSPSIRFVTVTVAALTPTEGGFQAVVASGGHPPTLVIHPAGEIEQVHADGVILGVFADATFEERAIHVGRSDVIVLYTDGVTEQREQPDLFNEDQLGRLVRNMRTSRHLDAAATAQLILDTVVDLSPREARDDIALVVARVTTPA
jgi:serine phosphatase RsbU (regulator of sigma subunit)